MKRIILLIVLVFTAYNVLPQSCNLSGDKITVGSSCQSTVNFLIGNGNAYINARDQITLAGGVSISSVLFHSFTASVNHTMVTQVANYPTPVDGTARILDKTNSAPGSIGGSVNISSTGAATYSLPILVSPGSHGVQPSLGIVYSSQSGNDILGYGFHLSGLSAITRVNKSIYYDGTTGPVTLTSADALSLDGQRLVSMGTNIYAPENNPYIAVAYDPTNNKFTVTTQDGVISEYGGTSDSKFQPINSTAVETWSIDRITDANNNYIQYIYIADNTNGENRISEIKYTGNGSIAPYNTITFSYDNRTDNNTVYIGGSAMKQTKLLSSIKVFAENSLAYDYEFTYFYDGQYSKLNQIGLTANGISYNPTIFNWMSWNVPDLTSISNSNLFSSGDYGALSSYFLKYSGDINGDGIQDVVEFANNIDMPSIAILFGKDANGNGASGNTLTLPGDPTPSKNTTDTTYYILDVQLVDWNGDGKDEVLAHCWVTYTPYDANGNEGTQYYSDEVLCYRSTGGSQFSSPSIISYHSCNSSEGYQHYYGDFDNDGVMDRITVYKSTMVESAIIECYIKGSTNTSLSIIGTNCSDLRPIDFDGDGQIELLILDKRGNGEIDKYSGSDFAVVPTGTSFFGLPNDLFTGDINGDGKTDFISYSTANGWKLYYSTGKGFVAGTMPSLGSNDPATGPCTLLLTDVNGDGKEDIVYAYNSIVTIYRSNGMSFTQVASFNPPTTATTGITLVRMFPNIDYNGQTGIVYVNNVDATYRLTSFNNQLNANLFVNNITDGNNNISAITYNTYTSATSEPAFPLREIRGPMKLATGLEIYNGQNNPWSNVTYTFNDGQMHMQGKGFLGFMTTTTSDTVSRVSSTNNYSTNVYQMRSLYYTWLQNSTTYKNNNLVTTVTNSTPVIYGNTVSGATNKLFLPVSLTSTVVNSATGFTTTNTVTFDGSAGMGRVTDQTSVTSDGWSTETKTIYAVISGNESKPTQVITKRTLGTDSYTNTVTYTYGNASYPFRVTSFTTMGRTTNYGTDGNNGSYYDNYGNITGTTVQVTDGTTPRSTSCRYDSYGRFVISSTDVTQLTSTASYRASDGALLTKVDPNNLTVSCNYSSGGNATIVTTTLPDGNTNISTTGWDVSGSGTALFYTQKSISNGNTITDYFNPIGWKLKETSYGFNSALMTTTWSYNDNGTVSTITPPGLTAIPETLSYNEPLYGRLSSDVGLNKNLSYSYNNSSTTVTDKTFSTPMSKTTTVDALGNVTHIGASTGNIGYTYFASGKVKKITTGGSSVKMTYDPLTLDQDTLSDPDAGTTIYTYNGFGQLKTQQDANGNTTTLNYDSYGRLYQKTGTGLTITYNYSSNPGTLGLLSSISRVNGNGSVTENYTYDILGRTKKVTTSGPVTPGGSATDFVTSYNYNGAGQIDGVSYPSGLSVNYIYDGVGNLKQINDATSSKKIWSGDAQNGLGQWTQYSLGNNLITKWAYDSKYMLNSIVTGTAASGTSIQNLGFRFNSLGCGQLANRSDHALSENFFYDGSDRLTSSQVGTGTAFTYSYIPPSGGVDNGNIYSSTLAGNYTYNATHPHAVDNVTGGQSPVQSATITTTNTYNIENKVLTIDNGSYHDDFIYGINGNRFRVDFKSSGVLTGSKVYIGNSEFGYNASGSVFYKRTIIYAPTGVCAVYQDSGNLKTCYYIHTDYLGSWLAITDNSGAVKQQYSYDAWGRPRDPATWKLKVISTTSPVNDMTNMQPRFDHGYTGQEMLCGFGLINMNGRLYDPYLQRFLSPDPDVQAPGNSQAYNRYSYCLNNPLRYTDPSGYNFWDWLNGTANHVGHWVERNWKPIVTTAAVIAVGVVVGIATAGIGDAVLIGALAGASAGLTGGVLGTALNGGDFMDCVGAGFMGMVSGGLFGAFGGVAASFAPPGAIWGGLYGAGTGGLLGGTSSAMQGGSFWQGAAMGAVFGGIGGSIGGYMSAKAQGLNPWTGAQLTRTNVNLAPLQPIPCNSVSSDNAPDLPNQLSHYTPNDPSGWTTIGQAEGEPVWFTPNSELNGPGALNGLSLKQMPNWRIDINTTDPNFDPSRVMYIQKVFQDYGHEGGQIEVVYKGTLDISKTQVNITKLP